MVRFTSVYSRKISFSANEEDYASLIFYAKFPSCTATKGGGAVICARFSRFSVKIFATIYRTNACHRCSDADPLGLERAPMPKWWTDGSEWNGHRLIIAHDPAVSRTAGAKRDSIIAELEKKAVEWADIERGFRVLKNEIEIGPVYHRLPQRICAHAAICFIALIMFRIMRTRLHGSKTRLSPGSALAALSRIQRHDAMINNTHPVTGLSTINKEQTEILSALRLKKPTLKTQLSLL